MDGGGLVWEGWGEGWYGVVWDYGCWVNWGRGLYGVGRRKKGEDWEGIVGGGGGSSFFLFIFFLFGWPSWRVHKHDDEVDDSEVRRVHSLVAY